MKMLLIALAAGGIIAGGTYAAATGLGGLQAQNVAAETDTITACDANGVSAFFNIANPSNGQPGSEIDGVNVKGIADACAGKNLQVTLYAAGGATLDSQAMALPNPFVSGTADDRFVTVVLLDTPHPKVKAVEALEVMINDFPT